MAKDSGGRMKFGSLFTGVGGFDLGFERAGMECVWQVEFDKACQSVLKKHWSETELFDDVRTVGKHNLKPVDVICGGFPCQDVSIAGKRAGLAGERSGLWHEFARIIDELEPKWVVIENVPGLLSSNKGRDFATVIRWLAERGYGVAWRILDSQYFGVAQRRRRVFIVASFGNGSASEILFEREGVRWDIEKGRKTGEDIAATIAGGSSKRHSDITSGQQDANVVVGALQARDYKGVGNQYVNEGKVITMSSGQANAEIMGVRRLTPTECERLQGFPDGWTDGQADSHRYKQMGNAVTVNVAEWIAKRIYKEEMQPVLCTREEVM